jgi:pyruvyl transferase EpsO
MNPELRKDTLPNPRQVRTNKSLIDYLQIRAREVLDRLIPPGSNVVLLDYPNNSNVGDSLIWLGEIRYLVERGLKPRYVCDLKNYDAKVLERVIDAHTVILLHGGGNFGTVWPEEQEFRERVLRDFPSVKTIQLPQTISFTSQEKIDEAARVIDAHENFTILTRGIPSYEFASASFESHVQLCPDMAFFIGPLAFDPDPPYDRFVLSRTDHEKANKWLEELESAERNDDLTFDISDWLEINFAERLFYRLERHSAGIRRITDKRNVQLLWVWNMLARASLARGMDLLNRGRVVITDRLHVHILSILMNKPHVVIDNSYKKITNFHHTWTEGYPRAKFVSTAAEALNAANELDIF